LPHAAARVRRLAEPSAATQARALCLAGWRLNGMPCFPLLQWGPAQAAASMAAAGGKDIVGSLAKFISEFNSQLASSKTGSLAQVRLFAAAITECCSAAAAA
jgi:hypothetical protein